MFVCFFSQGAYKLLGIGASENPHSLEWDLPSGTLQNSQ